MVGACDQRRTHVLAPHAHGPVARAREALGEEWAARHAVHRRVVPCVEQLLSRPVLSLVLVLLHGLRAMP